MKWLKRLGVLALVLIVAFTVGGMLLPSEYQIERSVEIAADPAMVHQLVGDLRQWSSWQPWVEIDPTIETTYGATTTGVGASESWKGKSGNGELTMTHSDAQSGVRYDMAFIEGENKLPSTGEIRYERNGEGTKVTWTMAGDIGGMTGGYIAAFMKPAIGKAFEDGLAKLKDQAEALAEAAPEAVEGEQDDSARNGSGTAAG